MDDHNTNTQKRYPKPPRTISASRMASFWLVIPICLFLCIMRGVGATGAFLVFLIWTVAQIIGTWMDWKHICDSPLAHMEIDNSYLLPQGFIIEKPGMPVREMTDDEKRQYIEYKKQQSAEKTNNRWRLDPPEHERDDLHFDYDDRTKRWYTKDEILEFIRKKNAAKKASDDQFKKINDIKMEIIWKYRIYDLEVVYNDPESIPEDIRDGLFKLVKEYQENYQECERLFKEYLKQPDFKWRYQSIRDVYKDMINQ